MVQHIIKFNLTGRQVAEMCDKGLDEDTPVEKATTPPQIRSFVKAMQKLEANGEEDFVRGLLYIEQSTPVALARIDATIEFLHRVRNRLSND